VEGWQAIIYPNGKQVVNVFEFLGLKERLQAEQRKNAALRAQMKEHDDALVELAAIVAANEEAIQGGASSE